MREILDPVEPEFLRLLFKHIFGALQRGKAGYPLKAGHLGVGQVR
jgi:hypothetical protein